MISAILEGLLMGLFLSVFIGPVFFLLIETSIKTGVRDAFVMDAGVILSDLLWIILLYWGVDKYLSPFLYNPIAMMVAGAVFIIFGIGNIISLKKINPKAIKRKSKLFRQGFVLNSVNPSVALFWLATVTFVVKEFNNESEQIVAFFASGFIAVLIFDSFKFIAAKKLRQYLNDKRQHILSIAVSITLMVFGLYMILSNAIQY
jgi:threonine/homoserine/homoserine lactone efflux protein